MIGLKSLKSFLESGIVMESRGGEFRCPKKRLQKF
jgi:hypothetical protein